MKDNFETINTQQTIAMKIEKKELYKCLFEGFCIGFALGGVIGYCHYFL